MQSLHEAIRTIGPQQTNAFGDVFYANLNSSSFCSQSAFNLFDATYGATLFNAYHLYVIIGTDSGLLPKFIQEKGTPKGTQYIFIEPQTIFTELRATGAISNGSPDFAFVNEIHWESTLNEKNFEEYLYINSISYVQSICAKENTMELYAELSWNIAERLKQLHYKKAVVSKQSFIIEQFYNLADNHTSSSLLKNLFTGKTAFILGGGPSLDAVIPWLFKHRTSVVVIAASRISKQLYECGLTPDIICSVDPYPVNWDVSKEMFLFKNPPILIHAYHIYHEILQQWPGQTYRLGDCLPWCSKLNEEVLPIIGPTVTNAAISIAKDLGFNSVYFAGIDYCYTLDGFTHAQGSIESAAGPQFNLTPTLIETYSGIMAPTGLDYIEARDSLETAIKHYSSSSTIKYYNTSPMAAKIEGVSYCPLDSLVLDNQPIDIKVLFYSVQKTNVLEFLNKAQKELASAKYQLIEIKKIAQAAYDNNESLYNSRGFIENKKQKRDLDQLEQLLQHKYSHLNHAIKSFSIHQFLQMTTPNKNAHLLTAEEIKSALRGYYQGYLDGTSQLIHYIQEAEKHLLARKEECQPKPDWNLLIDYCYKEKNYGRVHIWNNLKAIQLATAPQREKFTDLEYLFQKSIQSERAHISSAIKQNYSIELLKTKAQVLFKHKQKDHLQHLLLSLDKYKDKQGQIPYRFLINGYIAELDGRYEDALLSYQQLIDHADGPLEEALVRVLTIDINSGSDGTLAHQALECLSQFSPRYRPLYAESFCLRGEIQTAIDLYMQYILDFPEDIRVQIKLAKLYLGQGVYEGASIMIEHILEQSPNHPTALSLKDQLQKIR